jgi:hypothetical protein
MVNPSAELSAILLAAAMSATYALAWRLARRWPSLGKANLISVDRATLAVLGLLLAFTFSLAMTQNSQRRQRAVDDANEIGSLYRCAGLLDEPLRGRLQSLVRSYLEQRLTLAHAPNREATLSRELAAVNRMHSEMEGVVREAVTQKSFVSIPLINNFNEVVSIHAARLAAFNHHLPWSVLMLLGMAAITSIFMVGAEQAAAGARNLIQVAVFILLVSLVVWATLDLDQPGARVITANQEPLERLLATMAP